MTVCFMCRTETRRLLLLSILLLVLSACASSAKYPENSHIESLGKASIKNQSDSLNQDILLLMAFSGGGTRAAAMAYGVLDAFSQIEVSKTGSSHSLLDEIDAISAVSGGSITAAYFGLFGERIFDNFREKFLEKDVEQEIRDNIFSIGKMDWLTAKSYGRGDALAEYFQMTLFGDRPISELQDGDGPLVQINATDLFQGVRFSFSRNQFDLICSDVNKFPVARAVAASSAVPIIFNPLTLKNHAGSCGYKIPEWLPRALENPHNNPRRYREAQRQSIYLERERKPYIHLVDGGLTDNLGVQPLNDRLVTGEGLWKLMKLLGQARATKVIFVVVDASARLPTEWDMTPNIPPLSSVIEAATSAPLNNVSFETLEFLRSQKDAWAEAARIARCQETTECIPLDFSLVVLRLEDDTNPTRREQLLSIPTGFTLLPQQITDLIEATGEIVRRHPCFNLAEKDALKQSEGHCR